VPPREVRVGHAKREAASRKPYEDKENGTALCVGRFNKSSHHEPREQCHCGSVLFTMIEAGHSGHRWPEGRTEGSNQGGGWSPFAPLAASEAERRKCLHRLMDERRLSGGSLTYLRGFDNFVGCGICRTKPILEKPGQDIRPRDC
jgi:hypothetical protein